MIIQGLSWEGLLASEPHVSESKSYPVNVEVLWYRILIRGVIIELLHNGSESVRESIISECKDISTDTYIDSAKLRKNLHAYREKQKREVHYLHVQHCIILSRSMRRTCDSLACDLFYCVRIAAAQNHVPLTSALLPLCKIFVCSSAAT